MALCGHLEPWLETWPASGMTAGGRVFALPTPGPLMDGSASSSLLRTPNLPNPAEDARDPHARIASAHQPSVSDQVRALVLPAPTASMTTGAGTSGRDGGPNLQTAVDLLPTPRATDGTNGGPNQRGSSGDLMLPSAVQFLPTPKSTNNENWQNLDRYGMNLGQALGIAPLTSAPIPPPSDAGNTS